MDLMDRTDLGLHWRRSGSIQKDGGRTMSFMRQLDEKL